MSETRFHQRRSIRTLARWGWAFAVFVVALQTATHLVNALVLDPPHRWLDSAVDASVFGRANTVAIVLCAVFAGLGAALGPRTARRVLLLGIALVLLAVDDATGLHDRIRDFPHTFEVAAAVAFALLLGLVLVLLALEAREAPSAARRLLAAGLLVLGLAVAVRIVGAAGEVGRGIGETKKALGVAVEQGLDLGGWILVASGLAASLRDRS
jgi:FtsH-binding integral membrane protein